MLRVPLDYTATDQSTILRLDYSKDISKDIVTTDTTIYDLANAKFGKSYYNQATF